MGPTVPNTGSTFHYDPGSQPNIFNLVTKGWSTGSYQITATLDNGNQITGRDNSASIPA